MCFIQKSVPPPPLRRHTFFWKLNIWNVYGLYGLNSTLMLPVHELHLLDTLIIIRTVMNTIIICNGARSIVHNVHITSAERRRTLIFEQARFIREISILYLENLSLYRRSLTKCFASCFKTTFRMVRGYDGLILCYT